MFRGYLGNPARVWEHRECRKTEKCPYLYEDEQFKSSCKTHASGRNYSMHKDGQQNGNREKGGGQFGDERENADDDSSSEKESIDSGSWSYTDETLTFDNDQNRYWRQGGPWSLRGKGYRSTRGWHRGRGIGHQEKSPLHMSLKEKIHKFGVFLKNEIPEANAIQTIENGLARSRLGLKSNFHVDENKAGKPSFTGVLKLSGVFMGRSSGFTKKEAKHKAYETALDNLLQKSVDEIFQLKDPDIEAERDKDVVSAKLETSHNTHVVIRDTENAQAGNSKVSKNRDKEIVSAKLETNYNAHVQISDTERVQAGICMDADNRNEEAVSPESGGYHNTHVQISADSVQAGEYNTQIINIHPGQPVNIDQRGNDSNVIVNINVVQERRLSNSVRVMMLDCYLYRLPHGPIFTGSDRYIDLRIQMSRQDGLSVEHAEDLEDLGLEALRTEEGRQLVIRPIETALDGETDSTFKGSIIIRLRPKNKDSINKLKAAIESEQLHKILVRIIELEKVRSAVLGSHIILNATAYIPMEDVIEEDKREKGSIYIRLRSSSEDLYSRLKTKVETGHLQKILARISEIEPVHSALSGSDLVLNVTASVTEGNERPLVSEACSWKSQDQVKRLENDGSNIALNTFPDTPCRLCKNWMKCLHHSIETQPNTQFHSSSNADQHPRYGRRILNRAQFRCEVGPGSHIAQNIDTLLNYYHHSLVEEVQNTGVHIIHYVPIIYSDKVYETFLPFHKMDFGLGVYLVCSDGYPQSMEEKDEAIRRARSGLGEVKYTVAVKNCEHFATWALSHQIKDATRAEMLVAYNFDACCNKKTKISAVGSVGVLKKVIGKVSVKKAKAKCIQELGEHSIETVRKSTIETAKTKRIQALLENTVEPVIQTLFLAFYVSQLNESRTAGKISNIDFTRIIKRASEIIGSIAGGTAGAITGQELPFIVGIIRAFIGSYLTRTASVISCSVFYSV